MMSCSKKPRHSFSMGTTVFGSKTYVLMHPRCTLENLMLKFSLISLILSLASTNGKCMHSFRKCLLHTILFGNTLLQLKHEIVFFETGFFLITAFVDLILLPS